LSLYNELKIIRMDYVKIYRVNSLKILSINHIVKNIKHKSYRKNVMSKLYKSTKNRQHIKNEKN